MSALLVGLAGLVGCGVGVEEQLPPGPEVLGTRTAAHREQPWEPPGPALWVRHGGFTFDEYDYFLLQLSP